MADSDGVNEKHRFASFIEVMLERIDAENGLSPGFIFGI